MLVLILFFPGLVISGSSPPQIPLNNTAFDHKSIQDLTLPAMPALNLQTCGNNLQSQQLAALIQSDINQNRQLLVCNKKLNEIAAIKAKYIQESQDVWHNAGHLTPNQLLRQNGFELPRIYPIFGNQVEALAGGNEKVETVYQGFLNSPPHRKLLLGEDEFYLSQDQIGVAYIEDSNTHHQHYWVVIIAAMKKPMIDSKSIATTVPDKASNNHKRMKARKKYRNRHRSLNK